MHGPEKTRIISLRSPDTDIPFATGEHTPVHVPPPGSRVENRRLKEHAIDDAFRAFFARMPQEMVMPSYFDLARVPPDQFTGMIDFYNDAFRDFRRLLLEHAPYLEVPNTFLILGSLEKERGKMYVAHLWDDIALSLKGMVSQLILQKIKDNLYLFDAFAWNIHQAQALREKK